MDALNLLQSILPESLIKQVLLPFVVTEESFYEAAVMLSSDLKLYVNLVEEGHISFTESEFQTIMQTSLAHVICHPSSDVLGISPEEKTKRQIEFIDFLVKKGADPTEPIQTCNKLSFISSVDIARHTYVADSALQLAIKTRQLNLARHFVNGTVSCHINYFEEPCWDKENALELAIKTRYLEGVICLYEECKVDLSGCCNYPPTVVALECGFYEIAAYLLKCGDQLNSYEEKLYQYDLKRVRPFTKCSKEQLLEINKCMWADEESDEENDN